MATTQKPNQGNSLNPEVIKSNADAPSHFLHPKLSSSSQSNVYPSIDHNDTVQNLVSDEITTITTDSPASPSAPLEATKEVLLKIPGAILNLIDKEYSVELASGDFTVIRLRQGDNAVALYVSVGDEIQWPLAKDEIAVKVDDSHYFFSFRLPKSSDTEEAEAEADLFNYGLTIASKGQEDLLKELDAVLENCISFSVQKVLESAKKKRGVLDWSVAKEVSPKDLESVKKKEMMEKRCAAYWTTLAPNVEDYGGTAAKMIATGSGYAIKGILWCGDVTVDRLNWGNKVLKKRISPGSKAEISSKTLKRIIRSRNKI